MAKNKEKEEARKLAQKEKIEFDEIEKSIIEKYKGVSIPVVGKKKDKKKDGNKEQMEGYEEEGYKGGYVKRRALVDQQLMDNKKAHFSYADRKRRFFGEHGTFNSVDLAAWYSVYDQTEINKYKKLKN